MTLKDVISSIQRGSLPGKKKRKLLVMTHDEENFSPTVPLWSNV